MESKLKRPISVWIAQGILVVAALLFLLTFVLAALSSFVTEGVSAIRMLLVLLVNLGLITAFLTAVWGMSQRRRYGRWLGVALLSFLFLTFSYGQIARPAGPVEYYEYDNQTQMLAGVVTQIVFSGLFLFLILRLAFAKNVSDYFLPVKKRISPEPPPPPSFLH